MSGSSTLFHLSSEMELTLLSLPFPFFLFTEEGESVLLDVAGDGEIEDRPVLFFFRGVTSGFQSGSEGS